MADIDGLMNNISHTMLSTSCFVTFFGSHKSPMGYVLHFTDGETQAFKKVNFFCSNAVNHLSRKSLQINWKRFKTFVGNYMGGWVTPILALGKCTAL